MCILLTRLMWLVGALMWLVGILDVACGTFEVSFHRLFFAKKIFAICVSVCLVVSECWLLVGAGLYLE